MKRFLVSDRNCTLCIAAALCLWFMCVLVFLAHNSDSYNSQSQSTSSNINSNPHPLIKNNIRSNIKLDPNVLNKMVSSPSLDYLESISPEINENGWKPIYIHSKSVRMPIEEMDYLLEKYWLPNIKQNTIIQNKENNENNDNYDNIDNNQQHQTINIDNIDFNQKSRKKKQKKKRNKIERMFEREFEKKGESNNKINKLHNAPSTSSKSTLKYPSDWINTCYPASTHDTQCILKHMQYWSKGVSLIKSSGTKPVIKNKYVTFLKDCGGFNNIRQGFEFHVVVAWITDRTLVLPPDIGWYLIDTGHITRGKGASSQTNFPVWPDNQDRVNGVSNYDIWFDLDDMSLIIPVITTPQFIYREYESLGIPSKFSNDPNIVNRGKLGSQWINWLNNKANEMDVNLPWGQLSNVLYWPSIHQVELKNSRFINNAWIDNRKPREYDQHLRESKFIHFPSCRIDDPAGQTNYRYLGQIARSIAFDTIDADKQLKRVVRDNIHLKLEIMEYASLVVSILGMFEYTSYHIRRNELQYKYVWCSGEDSYMHTKQLIGDNEVLYIATDELKEDFFKIFQENGKRKVYKWKDFFGPNAIFDETKNIMPPAKLHGEIEMVICAMGRLFFGTKESTFSSYIGRLRGYLNAPYTQTLYHHYQLTKDIDESSKISKSNPGKPYKGQIYKIPFPDLWEDLSDNDDDVDHVHITL